MDYHAKIIAVDSEIREGVDDTLRLKTLRKKLYAIDNDCLTIDDYLLKYTIIQCIREMIKEG